MSVIITIANAKGGSGKSTTAVQLASFYSKNYKVELVDTDIQQSAATFHSYRCENEDLPQFACVSQFQPNSLTAELKRSNDLYDIIIIDTSGRDEGLARRAMLHSHIVLMPVQPSSFDMLATDHTIQAVSDCMAGNPDLKPFFILNNAQPKTRLELQGRKILEEFKEQGIMLLPSVVHQRVEFKACITFGQSAEEYNSKSKAADELRYLVKCLNKYIMED